MLKRLSVFSAASMSNCRTVFQGASYPMVTVVCKMSPGLPADQLKARQRASRTVVPAVYSAAISIC